jgi:hypothetical protein
VSCILAVVQAEFLRAFCAFTAKIRYGQEMVGMSTDEKLDSKPKRRRWRRGQEEEVVEAAVEDEEMDDEEEDEADARSLTPRDAWTPPTAAGHG